jgi:hypothetical protein
MKFTKILLIHSLSLALLFVKASAKKAKKNKKDGNASATTDPSVAETDCVVVVSVEKNGCSCKDDSAECTDANLAEITNNAVPEIIKEMLKYYRGGYCGRDRNLKGISRHLCSALGCAYCLDYDACNSPLWCCAECDNYGCANCDMGGCRLLEDEETYLDELPQERQLPSGKSEKSEKSKLEKKCGFREEVAEVEDLERFFSTFPFICNVHLLVNEELDDEKCAEKLKLSQ